MAHSLAEAEVEEEARLANPRMSLLLLHVHVQVVDRARELGQHAPLVLCLVMSFNKFLDRLKLLALQPPDRRLQPVSFGGSSDVARRVTPKGATHCDALRVLKQPLLAN